MSRLLEFASAKPAGTFLVERFSGTEELARLFEYRVDLLSEFGNIRPDELLGTNATVSLEIAGGGQPRHFNGYVSRFAVMGVVRTTAFKSGTAFQYQATLSPWLWFLTRASNCAIFQSKTYDAIVDEVLGRYAALKTAVTEISGPAERRDYCVQYRETDFNFVSRLLEQAGIYYYFRHENGKHTLVLADRPSAHAPQPGAATLRFSREDAVEATLRSWYLSTEVQPGAYAVEDFDYNKPNSALGKVASKDRPHKNAGFELFDYPGEYVDAAWGDTYAQMRLDEMYCQHELSHGGGVERNIRVGYKFKLADYPVAALNSEYLVVSHSFSADNNLASTSGGEGAHFDCKFSVIPAATQYRPRRITPKPSIAGPQTAMVVGPSGEEIHTDALGRIKLQFHWDRYSTGSDKDSCWVRVSQSLAGKGWGAINVPRVGQEVIVEFLEGDPDHPIVTGRVYNGDSKPPYALPDNKSRAGLITRSYPKGGNDQFNELRLDDKKGEEQVYLQAQRNLDIRIKRDRHDFVGNDSHRIVKKNVFDKFGEAVHTSVGGDQNAMVGGSLSFKVNQDSHLQVGKNILYDAGTEIHLKAGTKVVIEADTQISLKVGGNFIDINPSGVYIKGTMVMINSGGSAGSGSGAKPIVPQAAKEAMKSTGGEMSAPPTAPPKPTAYGPQATTFKTAAKSGTPFCAVCQGC